jgi:hypothetical protein
VASSGRIITQNSSAVAKDINGIQIMGQFAGRSTRLSHAVYGGGSSGWQLLSIEEWRPSGRLEKSRMASKELTCMNGIQIQGSGSKHGFAQHVFIFIKMKVAQLRQRNTGSSSTTLTK